MKINWKSWQTYFIIAWAIPFIIYGGTKPPPVVTTEGIKLKSVWQTPHHVDLEWQSTDERVAASPIKIQTWNDVQKIWVTSAELPAGSTSYRYEKFTCDRTYRWRVAAEVTEGE